MFVNYNGDIIHANQAVLPVTNRAFRYGDGLFESIRMSGGKIQFLELHIKRLKEGMKLLSFQFNPMHDDAFWKIRIEDLARRNKIFKEGRIRLSVFRNDGGLYTPEDNGYQYLIELNPISESGYSLNTRGLTIEIATGIPRFAHALSGIKTCNGLPFVMAGLYNKEHQLDDCLLVNQYGNLAEASASNIMLVKGNDVFTPDISQGCINGVMRNVVSEILRKEGYEVHEQAIPPAALLEAEEGFLTNSIKGVQWIMGYQKKRYFNKVSKMLVEKLNRV